MKKLILTLIAMAVLCGLLLTGCAPKEAAAPPAPEKHFEDVSITFFPGGNEGCPFASVVYRGAKAAEEDLGCKVDYVWSD